MQSMTYQHGHQTTAVATRSRALNIALWMLQVLLAAAYVAHGWLMVVATGRTGCDDERAVRSRFPPLHWGSRVARCGRSHLAWCHAHSALADGFGSSWPDDCDEQRHRLARVQG